MTTSSPRTNGGGRDTAAVRDTGVRDPRALSLVGALIDERLVDPARRDYALTVVDRVLAGQSAGSAPLKRRFAELAGYLGGAFVISAAGIFFSTQWDTLGHGEQVGLLVGIALLLALVGGGLAAMSKTGHTEERSGMTPVRRRLAGALLTAAAGSAAAAAGLQSGSTFSSVATHVLFAFGTLAVLSLLGYLLAPTVVGQLGTAVGAATALSAAFDRLGAVTPLGIGLTVLGVGVVWLLLTESGVWREVASARVIGCTMAIFGAQFVVLDFDVRWVGYLTLAVVATVAFLAYVARPAWPYLAAGVIAVTLVVPEALLDWTDNALGPAGVLLVTGVTLLVASLLGLRLRKEVTE